MHAAGFGSIESQCQHVLHVRADLVPNPAQSNSTMYEQAVCWGVTRVFTLGEYAKARHSCLTTESGVLRPGRDSGIRVKQRGTSGVGVEQRWGRYQSVLGPRVYPTLTKTKERQVTILRYIYEPDSQMCQQMTKGDRNECGS